MPHLKTMENVKQDVEAVDEVNVVNDEVQEEEEEERASLSPDDEDGEEYFTELQLATLEPMTWQQRKAFMLAPIQGEGWSCLYIERIRTAGMTRLARTYGLFNEHGMFLAMCEKKPCKTGSNYIISALPSSDSRSEPSCIGKIRSNFIGSEFTAYDRGDNPKKVKKNQESSIREELSHLRFESGLHALGSKGKKLRLTVPVMNDDDTRLKCQPRDPEKQGLNALFKDGAADFVSVFTNVPGVYSRQEQCRLIPWDLERAPILSSRNCQMAPIGDPDDPVLQFGKNNAKNFFLDLKYPLCPLQAFSVAVALLDYKLCVQ